MYQEELTCKIRGAVFEVYRQLGGGFLESIYQKALMLELVAQGLRVSHEKPLVMYYKGQQVGEFRADIIVEDRVLLELKAQKTLHPSSEAQIINYLKVTGLNIGLLINFTWPKATVKRIAL